LANPRGTTDALTQLPPQNAVMATTGLPPGKQPQWSADGRWWWDGQRWVPAPQAVRVRRTSHAPLIVGISAAAVVLVIVAAAAGLVSVVGLNPLGPPRLVLQSSEGVSPCSFPSQYWNGGSGTPVEWVLPANLAPISSCSFSVTFKNTGGTGGGHVTFAARYGPEYMDPQGFWHVRFIAASSVSCHADIPTTVTATTTTVQCSLSAPDANEYMGRYTYKIS